MSLFGAEICNSKDVRVDRATLGRYVHPVDLFRDLVLEPILQNWVRLAVSAFSGRRHGVGCGNLSVEYYRCGVVLMRGGGSTTQDT